MKSDKYATIVDAVVAMRKAGWEFDPVASNGAGSFAALLRFWHSGEREGWSKLGLMLADGETEVFGYVRKVEP